MPQAEMIIRVSVPRWVRLVLWLVQWPALALIWLGLLSRERACDLVLGLLNRGIRVQAK